MIKFTLPLMAFVKFQTVPIGMFSDYVVINQPCSETVLSHKDLIWIAWCIKAECVIVQAVPMACTTARCPLAFQMDDYVPWYSKHHPHEKVFLSKVPNSSRKIRHWYTQTALAKKPPECLTSPSVWPQSLGLDALQLLKLLKASGYLCIHK